MSAKCEVCKKPATVNCSGLDTPMLWFCDEHGADHAKICIEGQLSSPQAMTPADRKDEE